LKGGGFIPTSRGLKNIDDVLCLVFFHGQALVLAPFLH
jgi:hypothetical protein